jgi:hypothetical protein
MGAPEMDSPWSSSHCASERNQRRVSGPYGAAHCIDSARCRVPGPDRSPCDGSKRIRHMHGGFLAGGRTQPAVPPGRCGFASAKGARSSVSCQRASPNWLNASAMVLFGGRLAADPWACYRAEECATEQTRSSPRGILDPEVRGASVRWQSACPRTPIRTCRQNGRNARRGAE